MQISNTTLKKIVSIVVFAVICQAGYSQKIAAADMKKLRAKEYTIKDYDMYLIKDSLAEDSMLYDSIFTKTLLRALQIKNSFY